MKQTTILPTTQLTANRYELTVHHNWLYPAIEFGDTLFVNPDLLPRLGRKAVLRMKDGSNKVGLLTFEDDQTVHLITSFIEHDGNRYGVTVFIDHADIDAMHRVVGIRHPQITAE